MEFDNLFAIVVEDHKFQALVMSFHLQALKSHMRINIFKEIRNKCPNMVQILVSTSRLATSTNCVPDCTIVGMFIWSIYIAYALMIYDI